ncbi:TPA: acyl-CoA esterase, partial [Escherichia coli]
ALFKYVAVDPEGKPRALPVE